MIFLQELHLDNELPAVNRKVHDNPTLPQERGGHFPCLVSGMSDVGKRPKVRFGNYIVIRAQRILLKGSVFFMRYLSV